MRICCSQMSKRILKTFDYFDDDVTDNQSMAVIATKCKGIGEQRYLSFNNRYIAARTINLLLARCFKQQIFFCYCCCLQIILKKKIKRGENP